jgi:hypothetical protein
MNPLRTWIRRTVAAAFLVGTLSSCGGDTVGPDNSLNAIVGSWDAFRMVVVNKASPTTAPDLIKLGVTFFVDVQPSGQYTAILTSFGIPNTEFGRIEVRNEQLTFHREQPGPARSDIGTYRISADTLFLTGDTDFDFNLDGQAEPARLLTDFKKRR